MGIRIMSDERFARARAFNEARNAVHAAIRAGAHDYDREIDSLWRLAIAALHEMEAASHRQLDADLRILTGRTA